jgi:hypothetical protein
MGMDPFNAPFVGEGAAGTGCYCCGGFAPPPSPPPPPEAPPPPLGAPPA